ncbi:MAG TPA: thiol:disulfide interchange protein DsbA/DsbL, partial [Nevskiaceae bacterium]|nr:thiol:disulfide interchange protein DsbA/DsbL [Nevskiaceae bacterium]
MRTLLASLFAFFTLLPAAYADTYAEGKDYREARHAQPGTGKTIKVEEYFWYGCPHCYAAEPYLESWLRTRPADVDFVRVPNTLGHDVGKQHAKAFYTADFLKLLDQTHEAMFDAIHKEHRALNSPEAIQQFYTEKTGVPADKWNATFNGFAIDSRVRRADKDAMDYGISGTPTLVIDGRWLVDAKNPP